MHLSKASGKHFSFYDPVLLEKISYKYKRINDPEINRLYKDFKQALKRSLSISLKRQFTYVWYVRMHLIEATFVVSLKQSVS